MFYIKNRYSETIDYICVPLKKVNSVTLIEKHKVVKRIGKSKSGFKKRYRAPITQR